jgi:ATP-dependent Lon protease
MKSQGIKNFSIKNEIPDTDHETKKKFILKKGTEAEEMILETFQFLEQSRQFEVFSNHNISQCTDMLHTLHEKIQITMINVDKKDNMEKSLDDMQYIYDKLVSIFTNYGTLNLSKVLLVLFGSKYNKLQSHKEHEVIKSKLELIENFVIPCGFKQLTWCVPHESIKMIDKINDQIIKVEEQQQLECILPNGSYSALFQNVHGIRVIFRNDIHKKMIALNGLVKNIPLQFIKNNAYVDFRIQSILKQYTDKEEKELSQEVFERWVDSLTLKDILMYSDYDLLKLQHSIINDVKYVKNNSVDKIIKHFFDMDLISRRKMLLHLILYNSDNEVQYIAYMLYDLIGSQDSTDGNDNQEQRKIYETMSWKVKQYFKETMVNTIEFTQEALASGEDNQATLEQKVLLLRGNEKIKEKAMVKLKEIKGKSDDQASKSKQYLEGLLKIPFGNYRKEPILCKVDDLNEKFETSKQIINIEEKKKYTLFEIKKYNAEAMDTIESQFNKDFLEKCGVMKKKDLEIVLKTLTGENYTTKAKSIKAMKESLAKEEKEKLTEFYNTNFGKSMMLPLYKNCLTMKKELDCVEHDMNKITEYLDESIYGHEDAKNQILKIVGQWISGEQQGYCFGFEGSPGVGKTSLAKRGLSNCLRDENEKPRPFSFIALGGSCNGSTLEGHNYTYVNSTWGKIVDVLMECKCMNPIIYIDELDKVSRTEQGREIIGILTHLIDTTQNDEFQDRYFSGVPIDLSKALFIFSYNDPSLIDRILLDRIHRVRFDNLSWKDKLVIVNKFMMPELNEKMGFENTVNLSEEVIKHIIETYTMEPGVRKLKEILFDLFGEINLLLLNYEKREEKIELPIEVSPEDLGTKFLKKYRKIHETKIHKEPSAGTINGMWANALGKGGIIPIEARLFPSTTFLDLKLTGMQGDVMKESMNVAKTIAWSLLEKKQQKKLLKQFEETKQQGLHIHCPEGAVPKDGPSAGGAITLALYSLLSEKKIHNEISMTGEINLQGRITAIGGLESKILGSIRAGVKKVLYPVENQEDFDEFEKKYKDVMDLSLYSFHSVNNIKEAMSLAISK